MQQLFFFIQKYKFFLYFLLLQVIALILTINNHSFHKSKFISSANTITGSIYNKTSTFSEYLTLKTENELLSEENVALKNKLDKLLVKIDNLNSSVIEDTLAYNQKYNYINGKIIANEYSKANNFLTLNRGIKHGASSEMAVINSKGIVGITDYASNSYARVQSILNRNSKINARFKNSTYFGTLEWDAKDYTIVQLKDIPRQASYSIGDTIITGGKSTIFPEGIPIGTVLEKNNATSTINIINVKLFNDMSNLGNIQIIKNFDKIEIKKLENNTNE